MFDTMVAVDLAKRVFQLHVASMTGHLKDRKKLTPLQFRRYMADAPKCVVVFEACGGAHYWAREMIALGHEARIIPAQFFKPFVKRHKNDRNDAEAILVAAQRPEMRFTAVKSEDQQARAVVFRGRERLINQRTELVNALRSTLYEYGHTFPVGLGHVKRIAELIECPNCDLPALVVTECQDLLAQIAEKTERIEAKDKLIKHLAKESAVARRLQTMPGVGPITALAVEDPCLVIFEACGGAHYWAREMEALGHEVKLIAPQYARPFVKRQKNDAADAEAIVIAARQPEMRFGGEDMISQDILGRSRLFRRLKTGPHGHFVELYAARLAREGLVRHGTWLWLNIVGDFLDWIERSQLKLAHLDERVAERSWGTA